MSTLTPPRNDMRLRVLDPDLPFLAAEAAIDIDNLLSGRSQELEAVQRLAEQLKNSIDTSAAGGPARSLMDPATLSVLGEAVAQTPGGTSSPTMDDSLRAAARFAKELSLADAKTKRGDLEWARAFCVALSRTVAAYRSSILELRSPHPFRR